MTADEPPAPRPPGPALAGLTVLLALALVSFVALLAHLVSGPARDAFEDHLRRAGRFSVVNEGHGGRLPSFYR